MGEAVLTCLKVRRFRLCFRVNLLLKVAAEGEGGLRVVNNKCV